MVSQFTDSDGVVHTDPKVYLPKLAERVGSIYAPRKRKPAVYLGRQNTEEEIATGRPFWWEEAYRPLAGAEGCFKHLMDPCDLAELLLGMRKGGEPVPGPDGVTKSLLRAAVGLTPGSADVPTAPTPVARVLLAYVNARIRTRLCPAMANEGENFAHSEAWPPHEG